LATTRIRSLASIRSSQFAVETGVVVAGADYHRHGQRMTKNQRLLLRLEP